MTTVEQLPRRQRDVYEFIRREVESKGYGPTIREIGRALGMASPNGVRCHLKRLTDKGLVRREGFSMRTVRLVDGEGPPRVEVAAGLVVVEGRRKLTPAQARDLARRLTRAAGEAEG